MTEDNLASLKKIQKLTDPSLPEKKRLSEDQILVGIGIHLVKKLQGIAQTTLKRSRMACPCGCKEKLDYTPEMYIGKYVFYVFEKLNLDVTSCDSNIEVIIHKF